MCVCVERIDVKLDTLSHPFRSRLKNAMIRNLRIGDPASVRRVKKLECGSTLDPSYKATARTIPRVWIDVT